MPVKINGASSGSVTLAAPSSGSDVTLTLPTTALATTANVNTAVAPMGLVAVAPTSIANSGGSASLSNYTVSFSGVSSVSLNGVFTGDYDNYRVLVDTDGSQAQTISFRYRATGSDISAANYQTICNLVSSATATSWTNLQATNSGTSITLLDAGAAATISYDVTVYAPQIVAETKMSGTGQYRQGNSGGFTILGSVYKATTAMDGLSVIASAGTITGKISVYGYKK